MEVDRFACSNIFAGHKSFRPSVGIVRLAFEIETAIAITNTGSNMEPHLPTSSSSVSYPSHVSFTLIFLKVSDLGIKEFFSRTDWTRLTFYGPESFRIQYQDFDPFDYRKFLPRYSSLSRNLQYSTK
ncbi:hypothetical protein RvY_05025 [Ramazzottius varieornatus]|uniref:Uncharacterized protein n=1 Tax=Ramazzottius varieornatus TaxID=947166 RepID=A0A1D1UX54_RAMVA|nr:hypothetical protein RvY_05025 [Ramazzottius varieornatus]